MDETFDIHRNWTPEEAAQRWEEMREHEGLCKFSNHGGFHVAARFDDVLKVLMSPEIFGSSKGITLPPPDKVRSLHIPAEVDPPLHAQYRNIVQPLFGATQARAMEPDIAAIAADLVSRIPDGEPVDFVRMLARPLPIRVALMLLDVPLDHAEELEVMVEDLHHEVATGEARGGGKRLEAFAYSVLDRHSEALRDNKANVVTAILDGNVGGRPLSREEQMSMVRLIMVGGFDTTSIALANLAVWLSDNLEAAREMRDEPRRIDDLSEEIVRFSSPSTYLRREVMQPVELSGTQLQPGESVLVAYASANRDPRKFECPASIVPDRKPNPHVGFGAGRHRCIGSFIAKAQMRAAFEGLVDAFARIEIDTERPASYSSGLGQGISSLPMRLWRTDAINR